MDWNPGAKYETLVSRIQSLLDDGEERTTRDIYYALEARGHDYDYSEVKRAVKKGRRAGFIDPSQIVDTSRRAETTQDAGYSSPESFLDSAVDGIWNQYRENFWREQDSYVEVWLEKASLSSVFRPICDRWNVRLEATRGDWSDSKIYRAGRRLNSRIKEGKDVRILYFGDYNPSGFHAPVAIQVTMGHYAIEFREKVSSDDPLYFDIWPYDGPLDAGYADGSLMFDRIAMNPEHIERYDLPENPTPSSSDKDRTIRDNFLVAVTNGEDTNVELNALKEYHREEFEEMIEDGIRGYVDEELKGEVESRVREARQQLETAIEIDREALR